MQDCYFIDKMKDKLENKDEIGEIKDNSPVYSGTDVNSRLSFAHKKTEKLVAALYMITDFIKDIEPLKWQIRDRSLHMISIGADLTTASASERKELLRGYKAISTEVISLSEIAQYSKLISEMNHSILKGEFEKLMLTLEKEEGGGDDQGAVILHPEFFGKVPEIQSDHKTENGVFYNAETNVSKNIYKGQNQKASNVPSIDTSQVGQKTEYLPKITRFIEPKNTKTDRKTAITKLLSKKSGLNIKDFSQAIKGCSEKTIQRELLAMVAAGTLKKEGERRWSTYSLAF